MLNLTAPRITPLRADTLDDLWREAETLGVLRVWTLTHWRTTEITGYEVTLIGKRRNTALEVKRQHSSLLCALADAINEAREMGLGEPG